MELIGKLGLPKLDINTESNSFAHGFQNRSHSIHHSFLLGTRYGRDLLERLSKDARVLALNGQLLACGGRAHSFDVTFLAIWLVWCINIYGEEFANNQLENWLNSNEIEIINCLWILGVDIDESIELFDGYAITKTSDMPPSDDKEYFSQITPHLLALPPLPKCAITKRSKQRKSIFVPNFGAPPIPSFDPKIQAIQKEMHELAFLLNAANGVTCTPYMQTAYRPEITPIGYFGGSGGGFPMLDVTTSQAKPLLQDSLNRIRRIFPHFQSKSESEKTRLQLILSRLSQAKRRNQIEDKMLDLGIALEMLLLNDNEKDQLSLQFRLRGSWLIGESKEDRLEKWEVLKEIYNARSSVAHTGTLYKNKKEKIENIRMQIPEYFRITEEIIEKIIINGTPIWKNLVLGAQEINSHR